MLGVSEPGALNCYTLFHLIPLTLFVSRNLTLIYLLLSGSLDSLLCDPMAPTPNLVFFSTDVTDASGGVIIFVRQDLSFSELSTSSLCSLDPYYDYVEVNISLNASSSLSFLNVYALSFRSSPKNIKTNFFSPFILPSYVEAEWNFRASASASTASASSFHIRFHIPGSDDGSNMHEQNVNALLMCKNNIDLTCTEFYENIKSNVRLLKKGARHR